jgi:hypothetical protein
MRKRKLMATISLNAQISTDNSWICFLDHKMKCVLNWCRRWRRIKKQYQNHSTYCSWIHDKAQYDQTDINPFISINIQHFKFNNEAHISLKL